MSDGFHPDLAAAARKIPRFSFNPLLGMMARAAMRRRSKKPPPEVEGVQISDVSRPRNRTEGTADFRLYQPTTPGPHPAMLWIHGGGYILGGPEQDEANNIRMCRELGLTIVAVRYRLGPANPFPAGIDDCYAALLFMRDNAAELNIQPDLIAIGGASAGGGLAAGLVQMAHDRGEVPVAFQLLVYPMIDDRTAARVDPDPKHRRLWTNKSNRHGWKSYLGREPGGDDVPDHAVPSRRTDLSGLPPAWIGVGTCDLFHDEDVAYAEALRAANVPCDLTIIPGAFHGFEVAGDDMPVVQQFRAAQDKALRSALFT